MLTSPSKSVLTLKRQTISGKPSVSMLVDRTQATELLAAGAKWTGPSHYEPIEVRSKPARRITTLALKNFKGHENNSLRLGRMTLLVGDNASGKTSVLDALSILGGLYPHPVERLSGNSAPRDLIRRGATEPLELTFSGHNEGSEFYAAARITIGSDSADRWDLVAAAVQAELKIQAGAQFDPLRGGGAATGDWETFARIVGRVGMYRLRADAIAEATYVDKADIRMAVDGENTAGTLAAMKLEQDETFNIVETALRALIPAVERVRISRVPLHGRLGNKIYFDFRGAPAVPAHHASQGTLFVLALLATLYGRERPSVILLDDFDHALHPRAQRDLMVMLKRLLALPEFSDVQIVATTHSPYILDEVEPSDVYAFAVRDNGTVAVKSLSQHPDAETTKGKLTTGQLWSLDEERRWVLS